MRILFLLLICVQSFAANRLANSTDVSTFAATYPTEYAMYLREPTKHPLMTLNDIIIDTRTSIPNNSVVLGSLATTFAGARFGFTIWISATITGSPLKYFALGNDGTLWDDISDAANPIKIRTLGGQLHLRHTDTNPNNNTFIISDLEYINMQMERDDYPGYSYGNPGIYPKGTFGLRIDGEGYTDTGNQMLTFDGAIKSIKLSGAEIYGGFAGIRLFSTNVDPTQIVDVLWIQDCLIGQGFDGEGMYWSKSSSDGPYVVFKKVIMRNTVVTGRPLENYQIQHFLSNSETSLIENFISHNSATDWRGEVNTVGQSQNFQIVFEHGNTTFRKGIVDGTSANFFFITDGDQGTPDRAKKIVLDNILMNGTKYRAMYIQSTDVVTPIEINNSEFGTFTDEWLDGWTAAVPSTNWIHVQNAIEIIGRNNKYNGAMGVLFDGNVTRLNSAKNSTATVTGAGFTNVGLANDVEQWNVQYGALLPTAGTPIAYALNKEVYYRENQRYYKCILAHNSDVTRTPLNATYWLPLSWDLSGVRSDAVGWASGDTQSYLDPPWDFTLPANSEHNIKRRGLYFNPDNDDRTYFVWETATDASGTNARRLWRFKDRDASKSDILEEIESGNYVRRKIYPVTASGVGLPDVSDWLEIN